METAGVDYFLWVLAFCALVVAIWCLFVLSDGSDIALLGVIGGLFFAGLLSYAGLNDAEHRVQDKVAKAQLAKAGYSFTYASRLHIKLMAGDCQTELEVKKRPEGYRPVMRAVDNDGKYWATVPVDFLKTSFCHR
jgi:hypothetical protein